MFSHGDMPNTCGLLFADNQTIIIYYDVHGKCNKCLIDRIQ